MKTTLSVALLLIGIVGCGRESGTPPAPSPPATEVDAIVNKRVATVMAEELDRRNKLQQEEKAKAAKLLAEIERESERKRNQQEIANQEAILKDREETLKRAMASLTLEERKKVERVRDRLKKFGIWIGKRDLAFALGPARELLIDDIRAALARNDIDKDALGPAKDALSADDYAALVSSITKRNALAARLKLTSEEKLSAALRDHNFLLLGIRADFLEKLDEPLSSSQVRRYREEPLLQHVFEDYLDRQIAKEAASPEPKPADSSGADP